jgi:ribosomal protein S27E
MTEKNSVTFNAEIVNGQCPTCNEHTMLVSIASDYYRCVTCGSDLQQHINGKISYLPTFSAKSLQSKTDKLFGHE